MTYSQSRNYKPFNWRAALTADKPDWPTMFERALKWPTCACGNQDAEIPRFADGAPRDNELCVLGKWFMHDIAEQRADAALVTLKQIETRAAMLLEAQA
jgi:hypothetical protein